MRLLTMALIVVMSIGSASAQRSARRETAPPPRAIPVSPVRTLLPGDETNTDRLTRRAARRAASEGYRTEDVLAAYERDEAGRWFKRGEITVMSSESAVMETATALGLVELRRSFITTLGVDIVTFTAPTPLDTRASLRTLRRAHPTTPIDLNYIYAPQGGDLIDALSPEQARRIASATVAIIDGPISIHDDGLVAINFTTRRFVEGPLGDAAHGLAVTNILARAAGVTDLHIAAADIVPAGPIAGASAENLALALDWAALEGAGVINVSLTGPPHQALALVAAALGASGHVIVAAAGNDGPRAAPPYPAALPGVLAVTAIDRSGHVWRRATRGPHVSFAALGVNVLSADGTRMSGTSFATPVVSGALARLLPSPDPERRTLALATLRASARDLGIPGRDPTFGFGLIEAP